jgi:cytochrome c oxidase cbb3-type subunit 3
MPLRYAAVLAAWSAGMLAAASQPDPAAVERGRREFVQQCGFCHGEDATGGRAPDLIRSPLLSHDENGNELGPVIRNGRAGTEMPAFPRANVQDIAAFLHQRALEALHSARVPRDYPVEKLLTGDKTRGKTFFDAHCAACHSPASDLKGVGAKYSPIDLQSRFLYPAPPRRAAAMGLETADLTLPDGRKVSGRVAHIDEFTVSVVDEEGWRRSYDRDKVKLELHDPLEGHRKLLYQYTDRNVHDVFAYLESLK